MTDKLVIETQNPHTLTIVRDGNGYTVRIAKQGHNRAIAKLTSEDGAAIVAFLGVSNE